MTQLRQVTLHSGERAGIALLHAERVALKLELSSQAAQPSLPACAPPDDRGLDQKLLPFPRCPQGSGENRTLIGVRRGGLRRTFRLLEQGRLLRSWESGGGEHLVGRGSPLLPVPWRRAVRIRIGHLREGKVFGEAPGG